MSVPSKSRKRWLRFSLRTMLIGTAFVGVVLGLHLRGVRRQRLVKARIQELGGIYFSKWGFPISEDIVPNWPRHLLGEDHFQTVHHVNLSCTGVSDDQLEFLGDLPCLETLYLEDGTNVTDSGLRHLVEIDSLRNLYLPDTITDEGLAVLVNMPQLETLILSDSEVTDAAVDCLSRLTKLKWIYLDGTDVTLEGARRLKRRLPDTRITYVFGELTL